MVPIWADRNSDLRPAAGMRAHQAMAHRLHRHALVGQELGEAELPARIDQRVLADEILDLGLGRGVERVVGRAHVGELGVAAVGRDDAPAQDRILGRHGAERGVGMPQPVAQRRHAPLVVARELAAVLVEVGDVGEGRDRAAARNCAPSSWRLPRAARNCRVKASCCSSLMSWPGSTSTAWRSMPASIASTSAGVSGLRASMPVSARRCRVKRMDLDRSWSRRPLPISAAPRRCCRRRP